MEDYTTVSGVSIIGCPVIGIQSAGYNAGRQVEGVQINNVSITSELYPPEEDNVISDNDIYWNNFNYAGIRLNAKNSQIRGADVKLHLLNHGATGIAVTGSGSVTRSSVRVSSVAGDAIGMNAKGWAVLRNQVAVESQSGSAEGVGYVATTSSGQTILTLTGNYITIESGTDVYGLRVQTEVDSCTMDLINNQITISGVTGSAYGIDLDIRNSDCTANISNDSHHTISVSTTGDAYGIRSEAFETGFSLDIQSIISATAGDGAAYGINSFNAEDCNINIYSDDYLTTCTAKSTNESAYGIYIAATTPAESSIIISGVKILPTGGGSAYGIHTSEADVESLTIEKNAITVNTTISGDLYGINAAIAPVCNVTGNGVIVESSKGSAWGIYLTGDQISPLTLIDNTISLAFQNGQQIEENAYGIVIHDTNDDPNEYPSTTITNSTISIKMGGVEAIGIQITQGANSDITIASTKLQMICAGDTTGIQITPGTNSQITIDDIQKFGVNSTVGSAYGINVLDDAGGTISLFQVTPGVVNESAYINGYNEVCGIKIDDSISVTKLVIDNAAFAIETNFIGHSDAASGYGIRVPVPTDTDSYIANTTISIGQTAGRSFNACYGMQLTCNQDKSSIILQNNTLAAGYSRIGCYGIEFNNDAYADCSLSTSGATYFDIGRNNEWSKGNMYGLHVNNAGSNFTLNAAGLSILDGFSIKAYSGSTYFVGIDNTGVNASLNVTGANVVGAASGYATDPHWVYINADGSDQSINVSNCSFKYASSLPAKDYIPFTIVNGTSATITSCVIQNNRSDCGGKNTTACIPSSFTNNHPDYIAPLCWSNNGQLNYVLELTDAWSVSSSCLSGN